MIASTKSLAAVAVTLTAVAATSWAAPKPPPPMPAVPATPPDWAPRLRPLVLPPLTDSTPPLSGPQLLFVALNMNITSLKSVRPLDPANLADFVQDPANPVALQQLGKALFWEQQLGSDGQACASCHFHAGADARSKNQINPGFRNTIPSTGDMTFGNSPLKGNLQRPKFGPNYQLGALDFPLHRLLDPTNAASTVLSDTNDVVSSQGSFAADFMGLGVPYDVGRPSATSGLGTTFTVGGMQVRSVAPRNTPTVVNAVFNHRNFWDSRARAEFNGTNPIGLLDPTALAVEMVAGNALLHPVRIPDASTASQADGPPLSNVEMSYANRRFADLGRKMLGGQVQPLALQRVAVDDSLLGSLSRQRLSPGAKGLAASYLDLVRATFKAQWWDGGDWKVDLSSGSPVLTQTAALGPNVFTVAEYNFSLFFGLAIREYERTLVADDTPFDRFLRPQTVDDLNALGAPQLRGLQLFLGKARCVACHSGPELTNAGVTLVVRRGALAVSDGRPASPDLLERMVMGDGTVAVYDTGHYNIGVRPTSEDLGLGATIGPQNLPLSNAQRNQLCVKQAMAGGAALRDANNTCGVGRILARPFEAVRVLRLAAAILHDPPDVVALLSQAEDVIGPNDPLFFAESNPVGGAMIAMQAYNLMQALPGAARPDVQKLLKSAFMLMPDFQDPGFNDFDELNPVAPPLEPDERVAVNGAFKAPGLRNVALTAPYFHNGGQLTLEQVVEFYNRGGDFGTSTNMADFDTEIRPLGLTAGERADLVAFLQALTDERVRWERAPFDHPSLSIPNGGTSSSKTMAYFAGFPVLDDRFELPEVGAGGSAVPLGTAHTPVANFPDPQR